MSVLKDSSVLVIGGSSGMGHKTAKMAHSAGARVTIAGRDRSRLAAAQKDIGDIEIVQVDVGDEAAVERMFDTVGTVDHLACLAGTPADGRITETDTAKFTETVATRFWGPVYLCKYAASTMSSGSITFCTGSGIDRPDPGRSLVSAAAAGSETFSRAMALELAPIRVNVVRPGAVDTPLLARLAGEQKEVMLENLSKRLPVGRIAQPEEVAESILFLMTNDYITGVTLNVDGGASLL